MQNSKNGRRCVSLSQSKYLNKKYIAFDGMEFHSKKEGKRYEELKLMQGAGIISNLRCQVKYPLLPSQRKDGKVVERGISYIADFVYEQDGNVVIEDVKGYRDGGAYRVFSIKRKLMLWFHGLDVKEV